MSFTASETLKQCLDQLDTTKQDKLTFDSSPASGSANPVTSAGVFTAISGAGGIETGTTAPANTKKLWIDTTATTGGLKYYNGSAWVAVPVQYT